MGLSHGDLLNFGGLKKALPSYKLSLKRKWPIEEKEEG